LVHAYDADATFTYAIHTLTDRDTRTVRRGDDEAYTKYIRSSHNLCQEDKWKRYRDKIVYKGSMAIAVALSQLPPTEHDKNSFLLEFISVRRQIMVFTVRGILRDTTDVDHSSGAFKFFTRTFTVVPKEGDRMAIVNDDLILAPITQERLEKHNDQLRKMSELPDDLQLQPDSPDLVNNPVAVMSALSVSNGPGPSGLQIQQQLPMQPQIQQQLPLQQQAPMQPEVQQQQQLPYDRNDPAIQTAMIEAFSQQSGMKPDWAKKCLEDSRWDFDAAGRIFNELRAQIPADAFM